MTKHQMAFLWSAERLRETTGHIYFWTFTFRHVHNAWEYQNLWHKFQFDLANACPDDTCGIRVVQMHPGENGRGHGFHYHCLFNRWIDSRRIWRICRKHEMGCDAKKIKQKDWEKSVHYLARYLTKEAEPFPIRLRRWGSMFGFTANRMSDLKFQHPANDSIKYVMVFLGRAGVGSDLVGVLYSSPYMRGDWKTLLCALHYKEHRKFEIFNVKESYLEDLMGLNYYQAWISEDATIYEPGYMPNVFSDVEQPF